MRANPAWVRWHPVDASLADGNYTFGLRFLAFRHRPSCLLSATIAEPGERARKRANTQQAHKQPVRKAEQLAHQTVPRPGCAQRNS